MSVSPPILPSILHGGRLDLARTLFPQAPEPWIDLSTGVSPYPYPFPPLSPEVFTRLPDVAALAALERIAAAAYRAGPGAQVVAGAGTQAFIQSLPRLHWLPRSRPATRVSVLGLTYEEHAAAWRAAGAEVARVETLEEIAAAEIGVVVNPNNPDGRLEPAACLAETARAMAAKGGLLIVDEAFADFLPAEASLAPLAGEDGLVLLRSFGKAYGLPGVRLGFALCGAALAEPLRAILGPWSVSGPALAIGAAALADAPWLAARGVALAQDAARLDGLLAAAGFEIIGGTSLFRLVRHAAADRWFAHLARRGILTRRFGERPDRLRFGLPAAPAAWERLERALESGRNGL
ncbi:L-threonine O-3-phosphate decarboxylase [Methylosinus sp. sav-2]|uniref:threonine-phosphate decarboxylase CobD n=1 Tax=Methylosinus sp. sav-2 TaxID=2485168 RepID=UPI0004791A17|nr:threonine-phosphate decarboxylase CobD [Methylosinus sp. sav-2]TDX64839.1 L-threonine O-3-phosphate decarboxylase [Methylosinus sp. sav-2]